MNALTWLRNRRPVPPSPAPPPAPAPVLVAEPKPAEPTQPTPHIPFPREPEPGPARHGRRRNLVDCGCIGRYSVCRCPSRRNTTT